MESKPIVLVVEDSDELRVLITSMVEKIGMTAISAASPLEALIEMKKHSVNCIITDIHLKNGNGLSLVRRLRDTGSLLPIIVISAEASIPLEEQAFLMITSFFKKPLDMKLLSERLIRLTMPAKT